MMIFVPLPLTAIRLEIRRGVARIVKPGARYVVTRAGEEHRGAWVPESEPLPPGASDTFTESEARLVLPLLRGRGAAGRRGAEPTTPDGQLVDRACKELGITAGVLAERLGTDAAVISRARRGTLAGIHRERILEMLAKG